MILLPVLYASGTHRSTKRHELVMQKTFVFVFLTAEVAHTFLHLFPFRDPHFFKETLIGSLQHLHLAIGRALIGSIL